MRPIKRIEEWARQTADEGEECPIPKVEPVEGRTFDYETPLVESVECVVQAFTKGDPRMQKHQTSAELRHGVYSGRNPL